MKVALKKLVLRLCGLMRMTLIVFEALNIIININYMLKILEKLILKN